MSSLLAAVLLGLVEGLTEFLPISSTGHIIIVSHLLGLESRIVKTLVVIILLGSILAVTVIFWRLLFSSISSYFNHLLHREGLNEELKEESKKGRLIINHILLGITPAGVLGSIFHDSIKNLIFNLIDIICAMVAGATLLIVAEILKPKVLRAKELNDMTYYLAFLIGCFLCLALWPGFSRSGATISGGMLTGMSRCAAIDFSFLLAVPLMMGATMLDLYRCISILTVNDIPLFAVGFLTAFAVSLIVINTCLPLIKRISFIPLAVYRLIIAAIAYVVFI